MRGAHRRCRHGPRGRGRLRAVPAGARVHDRGRAHRRRALSIDRGAHRARAEALMRVLALVVTLLLFAACQTVPGHRPHAGHPLVRTQMVEIANEHHLKFMTDARAKGVIVTAADAGAARRGARRSAWASGSSTPPASAAAISGRSLLIQARRPGERLRQPNGKIVVYTGSSRSTKNEAGLAAVLGHEVGPRDRRHSAERLSHAMLAQTGVQRRTPPPPRTTRVSRP